MTCEVKAGTWAKLKANAMQCGQKRSNKIHRMRHCTAIFEGIKRSARRRCLKHCWPGCSLEASMVCAHAYESFFPHVNDTDK